MAQVVYPFDTPEKRKRKKGKKTARWDNNSRIANEVRFARSRPPDRWDWRENPWTDVL